MITNTLEDDEKYSFKVNGEWIEVVKSEAPNMGVAYDLLAEMEEPDVEEVPEPGKKEKKKKKAKTEIVEEKKEEEKLCKVRK